MHKFSTVATTSSDVLHRLCCVTRKRVPLPRVAQRAQVVAFVAS